MVGYSGKAAFAHLHLSVRRNGAVIDPFIGTNAPQPCPASSASPAPGRGLWMAGAVPPPAGPLLIEAGFVDQPIGTRQAETRSAAPIPLTATSPALVFFARYINLRPGDTIRLTISGPAGFRVENTSAPLERPKAQYIAFAGKKLKAARWPPGRYQAEVTLMRASRPAPARTYRLDLR